MHAAWYERMGPAREVLTVGELPTPQPGHGEVLVRLEASGVNPHDTKRRSGWLGPRMYAPRVIPHSDGAGTIERLGAGVRGLAEGERVFVYRAGSARPGEGTAAEYVIVPQANAVHLPDGVTFAEGACLGVPAFTAYHATLADGPVSGQWVLVQGGAGAVGIVAVELARWSGAKVIATVSSADKAAIHVRPVPTTLSTTAARMWPPASWRSRAGQVSSALSRSTSAPTSPSMAR